MPVQQKRTTIVSETGDRKLSIWELGTEGVAPIAIVNTSGVQWVPLLDTDAHLQVDVLSGGGTGEQYADGTVVNATYKGNLILGTDGTNYQILKVDTAGELQVDVLTMPAIVSSTNNIEIKTAAGVALNLDAAGDVQADIKSIAAGANLIGNVKISDGVETALVDASGNLMVNVAAGGAGDGAILDGVTSTIKATVLDYTNANPLAVRLTDTDGNYVGAGAGTQYADGAARGTATGTLAMGDDGTLIQSLKCDANGVLAIQDNGGSITVDGTFWQATQPVSIATNTPVGNVAHDSADSGAPLKIGGRADTTFQTAVADGDRVDALFDVYGQMRVRTDHANLWSYHLNTSTAQTDTTVKAAPGAGLSVYITDIVFSTGAATACNIFFGEGATTILGPYYLEAIAGRGLALHFQTPKKCTANTAVTVTTSASIAQAIDVMGYIAP